jgi:crossover junction endodeoxyribonuclease RusA
VTLRTLPLSTNALYRGRRFLTTEGKTNKEALAWEMRAQWRGKPLTGPIALDIALWWPDGRRHDLDNIKGLLDAFTGILYEDDSQIAELRIRKGIDGANPRVEIDAFNYAAQ